MTEASPRPGAEHIVQLQGAIIPMRKPRRFRRAPSPLGIRNLQAAYIRQLDSLMKNLQGIINDELAKDLERAVGSAKARLKFDDGTDIIERVFGRIRTVFFRERSVGNLRSLVRRMGMAINTRNVDNLRRQFKAVVGVDVIASEPWLKEEVEAFVRENVSLITSVSEKHLAEVEQLVLRNVKAGRGTGEIAIQLAKRFSVSSNKSDLIARDQTTKFHSRLNQLRHKQHSLERYRWRTSSDQRVRGANNPSTQGPNHRRLEGKIFRYDNPPETNRSSGDRNNPGEDIQCRCWAEPVFEDLFK